MDSLSELMTRDFLSESEWHDVVCGVQGLSRRQLPELWKHMLQRLAHSPPPICGDVSADQWVAMCMAQYREVYRCALKDAGVDNESIDVCCSKHGATVGRQGVDITTGVENLSKVLSQAAAEATKATTDAVTALTGVADIGRKLTDLETKSQSIETLVKESRAALEQLDKSVVGMDFKGVETRVDDVLKQEAAMAAEITKLNPQLAAMVAEDQRIYAFLLGLEKQGRDMTARLDTDFMTMKDKQTALLSKLELGDIETMRLQSTLGDIHSKLIEIDNKPGTENLVSRWDGLFDGMRHDMTSIRTDITGGLSDLNNSQRESVFAVKGMCTRFYDTFSAGVLAEQELNQLTSTFERLCDSLSHHVKCEDQIQLLRRRLALQSAELSQKITEATHTQTAAMAAMIAAANPLKADVFEEKMKALEKGSENEEEILKRLDRTLSVVQGMEAQYPGLMKTNKEELVAMIQQVLDSTKQDELKRMIQQLVDREVKGVDETQMFDRLDKTLNAAQNVESQISNMMRTQREIKDSIDNTELKAMVKQVVDSVQHFADRPTGAGGDSVDHIVKMELELRELRDKLQKVEQSKSEEIRQLNDELEKEKRANIEDPDVPVVDPQVELWKANRRWSYEIQEAQYTDIRKQFPPNKLFFSNGGYEYVAVLLPPELNELFMAGIRKFITAIFESKKDNSPNSPVTFVTGSKKPAPTISQANDDWLVYKGKSFCWFNRHALKTLHYTMNLYTLKKSLSESTLIDLEQSMGHLKWAMDYYGAVPVYLLILCLERYAFCDCFDDRLKIFTQKKNSIYFSSIKHGVFRLSQTGFNNIDYKQNPAEGAAGAKVHGMMNPPYDPDVFFHNFNLH